MTARAELLRDRVLFCPGRCERGAAALGEALPEFPDPARTSVSELLAWQPGAGCGALS